MADRGRPIPIGAAIYASAHKAVQPPDDRTYSAEVTVFQRNLPHHRIARAVFPYTRSNIIPPRLQIVKKNFRENHKVCFVFSYNLRAASGRSQCVHRLVVFVTPLGVLGISPPQSLEGRRAASGRSQCVHSLVVFVTPLGVLGISPAQSSEGRRAAIRPYAPYGLFHPARKPTALIRQCCSFAKQGLPLWGRLC